MQRKIETYIGEIKFKKSKDEIKLNSFVSSGFDFGFVSFINNDNTCVVNYFGSNNTEVEEIETLQSVRPRFHNEKIHGEVWKGAYSLLFYLLSTGNDIKVKPKLYNKPVKEGDTITIIDYKVLYENKKRIQCNEFKVTSIVDKKIWIINTVGVELVTLSVKRNQIKIKNRQNTFTLLDLVCPTCNK